MAIRSSHIAHCLISAALIVAMIPYVARAQEVQPTNTVPLIDLPDQTVPFSLFPRGITPPPGLRIEMSVAPPAENIPRTPYDLGKYGRIAVEYSRVTTLDGAHIGMAAQ